MASQGKEEHSLLRQPVNYYAVCDNTKNAILYISTQQNCMKYIRDRELENCTIWHIHDVEVFTKNPTSLYQ